MRPATATAPLPTLRGSRVWMVGAGGTGMSGLARLLLAAGARVAGEDREGGETADRLRADGIPIAEGPGGVIPDDAALVVATAAVGASHPTLRAAMERGVPVRTYAQMLGELHRVRTGISVAGTHGKSTTTCLLTWILLQAGLDPGFIAGATCAALGGNARPGAERVPSGARAGQPGLLVTESCEFDRSFHHLRPALAIVNNVEAEHLDCYGSLEDVIEAFQQFAASLPSARDGGFLLIAHEGAHRERVTRGIAATVETFGTHAQATHRVERLEDGSVRVTRAGAVSLAWRPRLMGAHNALNGAAAGVIALQLGASREAVERALESFAGLDRRQQFVGLARMPFGDVRVFDDYGHHPTEIRVTLQAIREATTPRRLVCVFQPHQHSRTRLLMDAFATAFGHADLVLLPDIHFVRDPEAERTKVSSEMLAERVRAAGTSALAVGSLDAALERARASLQVGDVLVTMGAGGVWRVARELVATGVGDAR